MKLLLLNSRDFLRYRNKVIESRRVMQTSGEILNSGRIYVTWGGGQSSILCNTSKDFQMVVKFSEKFLFTIEEKSESFNAMTTFA